MLKRFIRNNNIIMEVERVEKHENSNEFAKGARHYICTIIYKDRKIEVNYSMGMLCQGYPNCYKVLACLHADYTCSAYSFKKFCSNTGYDEYCETCDNINQKSNKVYNAVMNNNKKLEYLLKDKFTEFSNLEFKW